MPNPLSDIAALADQCVKCGLCLPHCPTYALKQDENESPRGRIALMQALAEKKLPIDKHLRSHIAHCLGCRTCERVCPSGVEYGVLLDKTRTLLRQKVPPSRFYSLLGKVGLKSVTEPKWQMFITGVLRFYQRSGLQYLARSTLLLNVLRLQKLERLLPRLSRPQKLVSFYPAMAKKAGRVGLFTGCLNNSFDVNTVVGTITLLQHLGYEIIIPDGQTCCGALHQHNGVPGTACVMAKQNIHAFQGQAIDRLVFLATGCGAQLSEYDRLPWQSDAEKIKAKEFTQQISEITDFIATHDLSHFQFTPLNRQVLVHTPCSLRNVLRKPDATQQLLRHIPGLTVRHLSNQIGCCGAAGTYMITQADMSQRLGNLTLSQIDRQKVDFITSTNIGCAIHLQANIGKNIEVLHPITLLNRQAHYSIQK